jgi:phosphomannomutase
MVSVSGIRGRVGYGLTPEVVATYAAGFGAWSAGRGKSKAIVVGRDSRVSGPMFHRVVVSALQSVGCTVIDIGLTTTPTCQLAVEHHHAAGGLMISASHNPIEWNALKFIAPTGLFLDGAEGTEMRASIDKGIPRATWDKLGTIEQDERAVSRHMERVLAIPYLDVEGIRKRKFKVALDCVRGAGSIIVPQLLERLGCTVSAINTEPDGRFPRSPEPTADNLKELEELVLKTGSAIGTTHWRWQRNWSSGTGRVRW